METIRKRLSPSDLSGAKWISSVQEVAGASDESLKRALITDDGAGQEVKMACLEELH